MSNYRTYLFVPLFACIATCKINCAYNRSAEQNKASKNIPFLIPIPKSGSTLLHKLVQKLLDTTVPWVQSINTHMPYIKRNMHIDPRTIEKIKKSRFTFSGHLYCTANHRKLISDSSFAAVFLYRDPRDQALSLLSSKYGKTVLKQLGLNANILQWPKERALNYIIAHIRPIYKRYMEWRNHPNVYSVKFEDIVGPKGGGSLEVQVEAITTIAKHLGVQISEEKTIEIANSLFGGTATFRRGIIGSWKEIFTKKQKILFKKHAGQLLIELGYEYNLDW